MNLSRGFVPIAEYALSNSVTLHILKGSVVDFGTEETGAIVNAANEGCLGGGGVDGAISEAGGENLRRDRLKLPVLRTEERLDGWGDLRTGHVRCQEGSAVITGPGEYGDLKVPYVIHAVGPMYQSYMREHFPHAHALLRRAYADSLDLAAKNEICDVGFSLLSSGIFRGPVRLTIVLGMAVRSIVSWSEKSGETSVTNVCLCAFDQKEADALHQVCKSLFESDTEIDQKSEKKYPQKGARKESPGISVNTFEGAKDQLSSKVQENTTVQKVENAKGSGEEGSRMAS